MDSTTGPRTGEVIDLFAGPGGLDVAARSLGLNVTGIEHSPDACATRRAAGLPTIQGDVRHYGPSLFPEATTLIGGPPCQSFSVAGRGEGRTVLAQILRRAKTMAAREDSTETGELDVRSLLVLEPLRWALEAMDLGAPFRTVVLEQVQAVQPVWDVYAELLRGEGYSVATGVLAAEQFGVPQTRRRAVLLASLDREVALPAPTHRPYRPGVAQGAGDPRLLPWVSMGQALDRPGPFEVISNYGTGGNATNRGRRTSGQPAATVTGKINRNRVVDPAGRDLPRFTHAEAGQLQGFPVDYPWSGADIAQQVGNAVPVGLGLHVLSAATGIPLAAPSASALLSA